MAFDTIPARFLSWAKTSPDRPAYFVRGPTAWASTSWRDHVAETRRIARAFIALGLRPGDKVAIVGYNRPEWVAFDMAAMLAGGIPAGIYTTSSPHEVAYILNHSEAAFLLVENETQWLKVLSQKENLPFLKRVVFMRGAAIPDDPLAISWEAFLALGDGTPEQAVDERVAGLKPDEAATFIYTSGTTGPPKAVMLSHRNIAWTAGSTGERLKINQDDQTLSYLPLSHVAEQMFTIFGTAVAGCPTYFARSMETLKEDIAESRPTVFFGVPRVWEKFYEAIRPKLEEASPVRRGIVAWARGVGARVSHLRMNGVAPTGALAAQYRLANRLVFSKLRERIGLDKARILVSGAAPITREVLEFFASLDIVIHEVYGQSEDCGPTSFNRDNAIRFGTVGQPLPDVEVQIAEDGEILVRGPNVFLGYYKDPAATAETVIDGWLHSGDLGSFDANGYLSITGRKKELIITSGGKNVAPNNIEEALRTIPLVNGAVVIGDRRKYLVALLTLKPDVGAAFAKEHGITGPLHEDPKVIAEVQKGLDRVNEEFARVESVRKFKILHRELSLEAGELTPTLKTKRKVVNANFANEIESLYVD